MAPEAIFSTTWPLPGKRWAPEAKKSVGVYALIWSDHAYVGMTISNNGFQGRWASHHRALFVRKRGNATTKAFRDLIKKNNLSAQDFTLLALASWPIPSEANAREVSDAIALVEVEKYDEVAQLGYKMLNNVRPRGTGYAKPVRRRRRRKRAR